MPRFYRFQSLPVTRNGIRDGKTRPCAVQQTSGFIHEEKDEKKRELTWWDSSGRCSRCHGGSSRRPGTRCPPSCEPHHISLVDVSIDGGRASVTHHPSRPFLLTSTLRPSISLFLFCRPARRVPLRRIRRCGTSLCGSAIGAAGCSRSAASRHARVRAARSQSRVGPGAPPRLANFTRPRPRPRDSYRAPNRILLCATRKFSCRSIKYKNFLIDMYLSYHYIITIFGYE